MFLGLLLIVTLGLPQILCDKCDTEKEPIKTCYENFNNYEIKVFPFYGKDDDELNKTCQAMNETLLCIEEFIAECDSDDQCIDECKGAAKQIKSHFLGGGQQVLYADICTDSDFRKDYLEHIMCLKDVKDKFDDCYDIKEKSVEHIHGLEGTEWIRALCCVFSWNHDCIVNATEKICGDDAAKFLSDANYMVSGQAIERQCQSFPHCSEPLLPGDQLPEENFYITPSSGSNELCVPVTLFIFTAALAIANKNFF